MITIMYVGKGQIFLPGFGYISPGMSSVPDEVVEKFDLLGMPGVTEVSNDDAVEG